MTIYLFDKWKKVRRILPPNSVTDLVHQESTGTLTGVVHSDIQVVNGDFIGFTCYDGHFRLFEVTGANLNDELHYIDITATDAIITELQVKVIEDLQQLHVKLDAAIKSILPGSEWVVTGPVPDRLENSRAYFTNAWTMLQTFMQLYEWRISCYYQFENGSITRKVIELQADIPIFRGRIFRSRLDASKVYVSKTGRHINRLYGLGPAQGSRDVQTNMTFANVVWSKANGDPVDKPKGQAWVGDPDAAPDDLPLFDITSFNEAADENDLLQKTFDELMVRKKPTVKAEATISDIETAPGYSREKARIGDLVAMILDTGGSIEAKIIDVKRNYIRKNDTKILIGDKRETIKDQVGSLIANATHTIERLTVYNNRFLENEKLIELNAEEIRLHGERIKLMATQSSVDDVSSRVNKVEIDLGAAEAAIRLKAEQSVVDALGTHVNTVQANLDAANASIALKASQSDLDEVSLLLDGMNGTLTVHANEISLKADRTYVDNLFAQTITADELYAKWLEVVDGSVIASMLSAEMLDVQSLVSGSVNTEYMSADNITTDDLSVNGYEFLSHSHTVSVDAGGTLKLGEVTADGGSFNIADTQYYKDGVSAALARGVESVNLQNMFGREGEIVARLTNGKEGTIAVSQGGIYGTGIAVTARGATVLTVDATPVYNNGWNDCRDAASSWKVLINYYSVGETLYDRDGNVATGPWYKGTEAYRYSLPAAK